MLCQTAFPTPHDRILRDVDCAFGALAVPRPSGGHVGISHMSHRPMYSGLMSLTFGLWHKTI